MDDYFSRSEALLGAEAMERLRAKRVILFGVGGVGSWCAETLIRTGLQHLTIVDDDTVQPSNINRQLPATRETMGRPKVEALRERLLSIAPEADISALCERVDSRWLETHDLADYDYVIDAIDSVADKAELLLCASHTRGVKIYSSMGAALRIDPTLVRVAEFGDVKGDALAKAVRERIKRSGRKLYKKVRCVYSLENAKQPTSSPDNGEKIKGSLMQVTAVFGCILAGLVIND